MSGTTNGDPPPADANDPDAPEPVGLTADVFDLAALVNTVKTTFKFREETALKVIDLALTFRLTKEQMARSDPFGAIQTIPGPPEATDPTPE